MHTTYQVSDYSLDSLGFLLSHRSEVVCGAHTGMTDRVCVTKTQSVSQQKSTQVFIWTDILYVYRMGGYLTKINTD